MSLLTGIFVVISKHTLKNMDPVIFYWVTLVASTPFILIPVWINGIPKVDTMFIVAVFGSAIFYTISKIFFWKSVKESILSDVYPLMSIGPIFTLVFSIIFLSEKLSAYAFLGSVITITGVYVLNISSAHEGFLKPFKLLFQNRLAFLMMLAVLIGSIVAIFDKTAINHTFPQAFLFVVLIENLIIIFGLLPWIIKKRRIAIPEIRNNAKLITILGVIFFLSNVMGFYALANSNPGIASSIFRTQIFFVFLFSFIFFKDRPKLETIIGTIIMIFGLVIIKLFS